jgi:molybdate transport system substrate-binding protein
MKSAQSLARLHILSGGAAKGLVEAMQGGFSAATGCAIDATYSAVGAMRDALVAGAPCDIAILTEALIEALAAESRVDMSTATRLGAVPTAVAIRLGDAPPDVSTGEMLRAALLASPAVFVPDTERSTAGIHVLRVLRMLGIDAQMQARLRTFPNGATAMRELAQSGAGAIGITQASEIIATAGVTLVGELPEGYRLAAVYTAAVCSDAREAALSRRFVALLGSAAAALARERAGFITA